MMHTRNYVDGDLDWIRKRVDFLHGQTGHSDAKLAALSHSWTITHDHYPVSVTGCFKLFRGVYHCWMIASDDVRECGLGFFRRTKTVIHTACTVHGIKRLTANVDAGNAENIRFAQMLGFAVEYIQKNAGPNACGDIAGMVYWPGGYDERRQTKGTRDRLRPDVGQLQQLDA